MRIILVVKTAIVFLFILNNLYAQEGFKVIIDTTVVSHFGPNLEEAAIESSYLITKKDYHLFQECSIQNCKDEILKKYVKTTIRLVESVEKNKDVPLNKCFSLNIQNRIFEKASESVIYKLDRGAFLFENTKGFQILSNCQDIKPEAIKLNLFYKQSLIATHDISNLKSLNSLFFDDLDHCYYIQFVIYSGSDVFNSNKFF